MHFIESIEIDMKQRHIKLSPHLNAAASTKHPLATLIIGPSTPGLNMIQRHVTKLILSTWIAKHRSHPTAWLRTRGSTKLDLERCLIVGILSPMQLGLVLQNNII